MRATYMIACLIAVSGCVDLSAVRRYGATSAAVMSSGSDALLAPSGVGFAHAQQVARTDLVRRVAADDAAKLDVDVARMRVQQPVAKLAAETLQLYFGALAEVADTGKTDVSAQADSIDKSLTSLGVLGAGTAPAAGSAAAILKVLRVPLDLAQQAAVRRLVTQADADVQVLTLYLQNYAAERAEIDAHAGVVVRHFFESSHDGTGDSGVRALIRARMWDEASSSQADVSAANIQRAALRAIGRDHAVLAGNAERLSSDKVLATLREDTPAIQAAIRPFL